MKIIFFGSDDFAQAHLLALIDSSHNVVACVTQPDKPKNRGMKLVISPIKECGGKNDIPVLQPFDLNEPGFVNQLKEFEADLFIVIAYGRFLPESLLSIPKKMPINVHASLLPKYRGAGPINWTVLKGDKETGITVMKMVKKMDAGDIIDAVKVKINDKDTAVTLREKMMREGPKMLVKTVDAIEKDKFKLTPQDPKKVSFAPKLTKEMGHIDWSKPAVEIRNLIRGLQPWPSAYTQLKGKGLKILGAEIVPLTRKATAGEIVEVNKNGFTVAAADQGLCVTEVHPEAGKPMSSRQFLAGHKLEKGNSLG